jgi:hypothetical protein
MLAIVLTLNISLALICLGLALLMLQLKEMLRRFNIAILNAEKKRTARFTVLPTIS